MRDGTKAASSGRSERYGLLPLIAASVIVFTSFVSVDRLRTS